MPKGSGLEKSKYLPNKLDLGKVKQLPSELGLGKFQLLPKAFGLGKLKELFKIFVLECWEVQTIARRYTFLIRGKFKQLPTGLILSLEKF